MADSTPPAAVLRLAAIVEFSEDAIVSKDLNGIVMSWNRSAERVFGYRADEIIGKSITTIVPIDRLDEEAEVLRRVRRGEAVDHFETIRRRKDGTLVPISLTVSPIRAPDGTIVGASKIARDISERHRAQAALAAAEARQQDLQQRLMALVDGSSALFESPEIDSVLPAAIALARSLVAADGYAIWRLDRANVWKIVASAALSDAFIQRMIATYQGGPVTPLPFMDPLVVADVATEPLLEEQRGLLAAEGIESMLVVPLSIADTASGTLVFYLRARHVFEPNEVQVAKAIANMTAAALATAELYDAQKRSRDEATRASRQASDANRAKDEFLATLSHEIRTPLNAVLGWTRMLRSGTVAPARIARALEVIERNAEAQLRLVEDMLDLSRIITGKLRLDLRPLRVADAISAAVETVLPAATARDIRVTVDAGPEAIVLGDQARLQQVVWNLLSNAVKFTPIGGRITVALRCAGPVVQVEVADTGEGIDPDVLPYVFDRFRQADSGTTRIHMGLGLGLAIVRHIVEMHGGRVSVQSGGRDTGATFTLSFPAATADQQSPSPAGTARGAAVAGALQPVLAGVRALVIDDDPDARELMTALLQARGAVVNAAASVREGLAVLDREVPDVILSDLAMPGEDGYDLIRLVRQRPAEAGGLVPAIAVTAYGQPRDSSRSLASGFQVHLTKPIDPVPFYSAVERLATGPCPGAAE